MEKHLPLQNQVNSNNHAIIVPVVMLKDDVLQKGNHVLIVQDRIIFRNRRHVQDLHEVSTELNRPLTAKPSWSGQAWTQTPQTTSNSYQR